MSLQVRSREHLGVAGESQSTRAFESVKGLGCVPLGAGAAESRHVADRATARSQPNRDAPARGGRATRPATPEPSLGAPRQFSLHARSSIRGGAGS